MFQAPFYRRILPWIFVAIFLASAPVLLLYTAGYRYNPKKGVLERHGTLIIDSFPKGAQIFLDDSDIQETTPVTLQNVVPGWHKIRLQKNGYFSWEKSLEIQAERVTFANQIWLWREQSPALVLEGPVRKVVPDPAGENIALVQDHVTSTTLDLWNPSSGRLLSHELPLTSSSTAVTVSWRDDGQAALFEGQSSDVSAAWIKLDAKDGVPAELLPPSTYQWSGHELIGVDKKSLFRLDTSSGALLRQTLEPGITDESQGLSLERSTSSELLLTNRAFGTKMYALPAGSWRFGSIRKPYILLEDGNRWLTFNLNTGAETQADEVIGDFPRWLTTGASLPAALFLNPHEVWLWKMNEAPELLWRQSTPLTQVAWHRSGSSIFISTEDHLFALSLDDRNGRLVTPLATFDHVFDFGVVGNKLYVAATKNGTRGLWSLDIE